MKKSSKSSTTMAKAAKTGKLSVSGMKAIRDKPAKPPANTAKDAPAPRARTTKIEQCLELLASPDGATIDELQATTGWQAHSVRGFLAGTVKNKLGLTLESRKADDGARRYYIAKTGAGRL